jgi:hypothetical protein
LQDISCFFIPAHLHQPARRLREEVDANSNEEDENQLKGEGCTPSHGLVIVQGGEVFDPVGQRKTSDILIGVA